MKNETQRYNANERSNHWAVATLPFMAGLSELALLHPALFWLTDLFGGGPWTRTLYLFLGLAIFVFFPDLVVYFAHYSQVQKNDIQWLKRWRDVVNNREENLPEVGRYNAGQKLLFWALLLSMLTLLVIGIVIWCRYPSAWFGIKAVHLSTFLHAFAAFVLIASIIVHIYTGIWVKGSMGVMLYGKVSRAWACKYHNGWLKEVSRGEEH